MNKSDKTKNIRSIEEIALDYLKCTEAKQVMRKDHTILTRLSNNKGGK